MTFRGTVRNGKVELDETPDWPDGTAVDVFPIRGGLDAVYRMFESGVRDKSVPTDLAAEHDHYAYGAPKRGRQNAVKSTIKRSAAKTKARTKVKKK